MTEDQASGFGEAVRRRRLELGLSQGELDRRMDRKSGFTYMYERGARVPGVNVVGMFARALEMSAAELMESITRK